MAFDQPFDDRPGRIWYDGEMVPWQDATLHVLSHALHYASAVFEGERIYNGRIFKLTEHTERLFHSAKRLDMRILTRWQKLTTLATHWSPTQVLKMVTCDQSFGVVPNLWAYPPSKPKFT